MRKWYVFDQYDCFDDFETAASAAYYAESLVGNDVANEGVHIAYMTKQEADAYCESGKFPFSK